MRDNIVLPRPRWNSGKPAAEVFSPMRRRSSVPRRKAVPPMRMILRCRQGLPQGINPGTILAVIKFQKKMEDTRKYDHLENPETSSDADRHDFSGCSAGLRQGR